MSKAKPRTMMDRIYATVQVLSLRRFPITEDIYHAGVWKAFELGKRYGIAMKEEDK